MTVKPTRTGLPEAWRRGSRIPAALCRDVPTRLARELPNLGPYSRTLQIESEGPYYQTCNMFYPRELLAELGGLPGDDHR